MRKNSLISGRVLKAIKSLDSKYSELEEYNVNYWSKYLLSVWLIFGAFINFLFYCLLFVEINFTQKLIVVYISILLSTTFLLIINTASSVNYEANKVYKLLNRVMILNNIGLFNKRFKSRNKSLMAYSSKVKVNTI
jgi:hypothetical protein